MRCSGKRQPTHAQTGRRAHREEGQQLTVREHSRCDYDWVLLLPTAMCTNAANDINNALHACAAGDAAPTIVLEFSPYMN